MPLAKIVDGVNMVLSAATMLSNPLGPVKVYTGVPTPVSPTLLRMRGLPIHSSVGMVVILATVGTGLTCKEAEEAAGVVMPVPPQMLPSTQ